MLLVPLQNLKKTALKELRKTGLFPDQLLNVFFIVTPCVSDEFYGPEGD